MPRLKENDGRLSGQQFQLLQEALLDSYALTALTAMLRFRLDRQREHLSLANDLPTVVFDVISRAEDESWTAELLAGARASRPENARLLVLGQQFGLSTPTPPRPELELRIKEANGFLDVVQWREGLGRAENRVCRVEETESGGAPFGIGTGFLVGPDLIMTNHHVLKRVIAGKVPSQQVGFRFDYKTLADGVAVNPGRIYRLATTSWDVDHSPHSPLDEQVDPPQAPGPEELDYALVRLSASAGNDPISGGKDADPDAPPRGWIDLPDREHDFDKEKALFILQHPDARPLKLAIDTESVVGTAARDGMQTRVRHTTNTEPGSSGSPCFDANWNLVALHHSGDPRYYAHGVAPAYNQAVPVKAIRALLTKRDRVGLLGAQEL